jgi:ABC-type Na+ efflux pump permease subunit
MRTHIIRALLRKEALRYRYNWGLLVLVVALIALAALLSLSARMRVLSLTGDVVPLRRVVLLLPQQSPRAEQWGLFLAQHPPGMRVEIKHGGERPPVLPEDTAAIELPEEAAPLRVRYWYPEANPEAMHALRDWFGRESAKHLQQSPTVEEVSQRGKSRSGLERLPLLFTALVVFGLYILSFNLFLTSTGEEREKRILLALLLSPARPSEVLGAKAIFYAGASLLVSGAIAGMYQPSLLLVPGFWCGVLLGSLGYISLGTVAICLVRRQTTLSTVSILYMVGTTLITFLGSFLPLFGVIKLFLLEEYLYRFLHQTFSGKAVVGGAWNLVALGVLSLAWLGFSVWFFRRRGLDQNG